MNRLVSAGLCAVLFSGCGWFGAKEKRVRKGSKVKVHYTVSAGGTILDSTLKREPMEYRQGSGKLITGLEEQLLGMKEGDERTLNVPPEKGYGLFDPEAVQNVPLARFGAQGRRLRKGMSVQGLRRGRLVKAKVLAVREGQVMLDFNHPLSGKTLTFKVKVVEVASSKRKGS